MSSPTLTMAVISSAGTTRDQAREHSGGPDAAAQGHQHGCEHRSARRGGPSDGPWYHRRPPCPPPSRRTGTRRWCRSCGRPPASTATSRPTSSRPAPGTRRSLTFAEWDRAADGVAGYLAGLGVRKGDVVCLLLPSCIDYAVLYAALQRLGAITSGINPRMGAARWPPCSSGPPRCCSSSTPTAAPSRAAGRAAGRPGPRWRRPGGRRRRRWPELAAHDPVAVVWTSGTTGRPEGRALRSRQPGRGGPRHRRAEPTRRPPALTPALRARRLHDPRLGRDRARRDHGDHPDAVAGRRRHPHHGRGEHHRRPGGADAVGAHAGPSTSSPQPT